MDCIFCKIAAGEIPCAKIYEDGDVIVFLDIAPVNFGHALVVPKRHCENIADAPEETLAKLIAAAKKIGRALLATGDYNGFNLGVNNGQSAGQAVPHLHFHVIPRREGDGLTHWGARAYGEGEMGKWAERVRKLIS
jgi:histidine triad (HIT) family protein